MILRLREYLRWPVLWIGVAYCFSRYAELTSLETPVDCLVACLAWCAFALLLVRLSSLVLKDPVKLELVTFILSLYVLYYSDLGGAMARHLFPGLGRYRVAVPLLLSVAAIVVWGVAATRRDLRGIRRFFRIFVALQVCYAFARVGFQLAVNRTPDAQLFERATCIPAVRVDVPTKSAAPKPPDIYYLLFDARTSPGSLRRFWSYDDTPFVDSMRARGFVLPHHSRSFAMNTMYSMASTLNICADANVLHEDWGFALRMVKENGVVGFLRTCSYDIVNLSPFSFPGAPRYYWERYLSDGPLAGAEVILSDMLVVHFVERHTGWTATDLVDAVVRAVHAKGERPKFIYAHFPIPHFPYYLDRNGGEIPWVHESGPTDSAAYLAQVIGTNKVILAVVNSILANAATPPVIVVQGDHGFREIHQAGGDEERWTMLNAYHFPAPAPAVSDSISPYNTFRVIFNRYLGTALPLLDDNPAGIRERDSR